MKTKYYFENEDAENCYTEDEFQDRMKFNELTEMTVLEANPANGSEYIYCKESGSVGEKHDCGKQCPDYEPRNGKSGMCKNRGLLFEHGEEITLKLKSC